MINNEFLFDLNGLNDSGNILSRYNYSDTTRLLHRLFYAHRKHMHSLAGWIIDIPEFEIKTKFAHHLYFHAEAAMSLKKRLTELRVNEKTINRPVDDLHVFFEEIKASENCHSYVYCVSKIIPQAFIDAYIDYLQGTSQILDQPSCRVVQNILIDLYDMNEFGAKICSLYKRHNILSASIEDWDTHLTKVLASIGGITGTREFSQEKPKLLQLTNSFKRKMQCRRDERFKTFNHTRDYVRADEFASSIKDEFKRDLFAMARTQRDEIDAIETFANVLYDYGDTIPFEFQHDLARFIWDEARHAEIGQQLLKSMGYDPFDIPCGLIGINVRTELPPQIAFAQINIFGESNQPLHLRQTIARAVERGEKLAANALEYIYTDEAMHIKRGRKWIKELSKDKSFEEIKSEARSASLDALFKQGIYNEDYILYLSDHDLGMLIGE